MLRMPPDQLLDSKHTLREWTLWSWLRMALVEKRRFFYFWDRLHGL